MNDKKRALGRGLNSLLGNASEVNLQQTAVTGAIISIPVDMIEVNPYQPRNNFEDEALNDLADSIAKIGIIQPITVCRTEGGKFTLIAGERRYRASKIAGLTEVPVFIRTADSELELLQMALIENIQREDLNPIDVSLSFKRLVDEFSLTQEELSSKVGKKRSTVTNYLRLLKLPPEIQASLRDAQITMGHARALIGVVDEAKQLKLFQRLLQKGLSVREVESAAKLLNEQNTKQKPAAETKKYYTGLKKELTEKLGLKLDLRKDNKGFVNLVIKCASDKELEKIVALLKN